MFAKISNKHKMKSPVTSSSDDLVEYIRHPATA